MPMTLCREGTKLGASRSEEPMTDDTPPHQIRSTRTGFQACLCHQFAIISTVSHTFGAHDFLHLMKVTVIQ